MSDLKTTLDALRDLSLSELKSVQSRCLYLIGTKHREETREQEVDRLLQEQHDEQGGKHGDDWKQPVAAGQAYPKGAVRKHKGKLWRGLVPVNVWEPGVAAWREIALDDDGNEVPAPYREPGSAAGAYDQGERMQWTDGKVYEAVRDGVVHSPDEYPDDWRLVEDGEDDDPDEDEGTEPEPEPEPEPDPEEPEEPDVPEWSPDGHAYTVGDLLTYDGTVYRVRQDHTSQAGWTPDALPALYEPQDES